MIGSFKYSKVKGAPGHWDISYKGPFDTDWRLLCVIEKGVGGWLLPMSDRTLGPYNSRWHAGYAYLTSVSLLPLANKIESETENKWRKAARAYRQNIQLSHAQADAIFSVLVAKCRAAESRRESFICYQMEDGHSSTEYRFQGLLGFGGKFDNTPMRWYVSAYREETGPEEALIIAETNEMLQKMYLNTFGA